MFDASLDRNMRRGKKYVNSLIVTVIISYIFKYNEWKVKCLENFKNMFDNRIKIL